MIVLKSVERESFTGIFLEVWGRSRTWRDSDIRVVMVYCFDEVNVVSPGSENITETDLVFVQQHEPEFFQYDWKSRRHDDPSPLFVLIFENKDLEVVLRLTHEVR